MHGAVEEQTLISRTLVLGGRWGPCMCCSSAVFMSDADTMSFQILKDKKFIVGSGMIKNKRKFYDLGKQ